MSTDLGSNMDDANDEIVAVSAPMPKKRVTAKAAPVGMPEYVKIVLEENDAIPPTGLFVGLNGRGYLIRAGEEVAVPRGVVDILNNARMAMPTTDSGGRVTGYRERQRYPFRLV